MKCENCNNDHDGTYGSGRFCSVTCSRSFSTKNNRSQTNAKISSSLKGRKVGGALIKNRGPMKEETKIAISKAAEKKRNKKPFDQIGRCNRRKLVLEEQSHKCLFCDISTWRGKLISLQLDHIDGDRLNNTRENLRALCPNCHSQTETWGIRNMKITSEEHGLRSGRRIQVL